MNLPDSSKPGKKKAEVLEKLTGTEIYSIISNTVYSKTTAIRNEWKELSRPYGEYSPAYPGRNRDITATIGQTPETRKGSSTKNEEIQRKIRWIEQLEQINQSKSRPRPPFRMPKSTSRSTSPVSLVTADGSIESSRLFFGLKNECTTHLVSQTELLRQTEQALSDLNEKPRKPFNRWNGKNHW